MALYSLTDVARILFSLVVVFVLPSYVIIQSLRKAANITLIDFILLITFTSLLVKPVYYAVTSLFTAFSYYTLIFTYVPLAILTLLTSSYLGESKRIKFKRNSPILLYRDIAIVFFLILFSLYNIRYAITNYSADAGWHAFWSRQMITNHTIPTYSLFEPFFSKVLYTFVAHGLISEMIMLTSLGADEAINSLSAFFFLISALAIYKIASIVIKRVDLSLLAATLYASAYFPGGYVARGNLPDIVGHTFFLLFLCLLLDGNFFPNSRTYVPVVAVAILTALSLHQYSSAIFVLFLIIYIAVMICNSRRPLALLHNLKVGLVHIIIPVLILYLLPLYYTPYVANPSESWRIITSSNWSPYRIPSLIQVDIYIQYIVRIIASLTEADIFIAILGVAGVIYTLVQVLKIVMNRHRYYIPKSLTVIISWFLTSLILAAFSPLEPQRFIWHMTEPLIIFSVLMVNGLSDGLWALLKPAHKVSATWKLYRVRVTWFGRYCRKIYCNLTKLKLDAKAVIAFTLIILLLVVSVGQASAERYKFESPYLQEYGALSSYIKDLGLSLDKKILITCDYDASCTWLLYYVGNPVIIPIAKFAIYVSPPRESTIFTQLYQLYNPTSSVDTICKTAKEYNIKYIVLHSDKEKVSSVSPPFYKEVSFGYLWLYKVECSRVN